MCPTAARPTEPEHGAAPPRAAPATPRAAAASTRPGRPLAGLERRATTRAHRCAGETVDTKGSTTGLAGARSGVTTVGRAGVEQVVLADPASASHRHLGEELLDDDGSCPVTADRDDDPARRAHRSDHRVLRVGVGLVPLLGRRQQEQRVVHCHADDHGADGVEHPVVRCGADVAERPEPVEHSEAVERGQAVASGDRAVEGDGCELRGRQQRAQVFGAEARDRAGFGREPMPPILSPATHRAIRSSMQPSLPSPMPMPHIASPSSAWSSPSPSPT